MESALAASRISGRSPCDTYLQKGQQNSAPIDCLHIHAKDPMRGLLASLSVGFPETVVLLPLYSSALRMATLCDLSDQEKDLASPQKPRTLLGPPAAICTYVDLILDIVTAKSAIHEKEHWPKHCLVNRKLRSPKVFIILQHITSVSMGVCPFQNDMLSISRTACASRFHKQSHRWITQEANSNSSREISFGL